MDAISGIIPPLVTPLSDVDRLDVEGLTRLIEHVISGGVHGIFVLGTTGEGPGLSYRLRREMIQQAVRIVNGRIPVLVGISDTAFVESVALADDAAKAGASAVVLSTPYYFPAGQTELTSYVRNIAPRLNLPLVLYNMPSLTKVWFEFETLQSLLELPAIVGLKDSSGDLQYFEKIMRLKSIRPDFSIMIGPEAMLPEALALGGDGVVAGGANVCPTLFVDAYEAAQVGDEERLCELHQRIVAFQDIYAVGKYASRHIKATKCALSLLGICHDVVAEPFHHFLAPERARVGELLTQQGILPTPNEDPLRT